MTRPNTAQYVALCSAKPYHFFNQSANSTWMLKFFPNFRSNSITLIPCQFTFLKIKKYR